MDDRWSAIAGRAVAGLGVRPGELIAVHEHAGHPAALAALLLAIEQAGATPLPEIAPPAYVMRLLESTEPAHLATWDRHWSTWAAQVNRALVLHGGGLPDLAPAPPAAVAAWLAAQGRVRALTEARHLPTLVLAVPTAAVAARCGWPLADLEAAVLPALAVPAATLQAAIAAVLARVQRRSTLIVESGAGCVLRCRLEGRGWMADDGVIDATDLGAGACVSNLPAGSIYTTVVESATDGTLAIPVAGPADDVVLHFQGGRIIHIAAASGAEELATFLDGHTGEPRRISHLGIGLNPALGGPVGWTIVDEHLPGTLFVALGENRYMGGQNESSLNVDYQVPGVTLRVDDQVIVEAGRIVAGMGG